jgi:hypothetical protein
MRGVSRPGRAATSIGVADWVGRILAIGGALLAVTLAVPAAAHRQLLVPPGPWVAGCVLAVISGVLLSALAAAGFDPRRALGRVPQVLSQDILGFAAVMLLWGLSTLIGAGGGGGGGGTSATGARGRRANFASGLLDAGMLARLLGVAEVAVEAESFSTSTVSRARASAVDGRGLRRAPMLRLMVTQGRVAAAHWERDRRSLREVAPATLEGEDRLSIRADDTLISLRLRGFPGDASAVLREVGKQALARLYAPAGAASADSAEVS